MLLEGEGSPSHLSLSGTFCMLKVKTEWGESVPESHLLRQPTNWVRSRGRPVTLDSELFCSLAFQASKHPPVLPFFHIQPVLALHLSVSLKATSLGDLSLGPQPFPDLAPLVTWGLLRGFGPCSAVWSVHCPPSPGPLGVREAWACAFLGNTDVLLLVAAPPPLAQGCPAFEKMACGLLLRVKACIC